MRFDSRSYTSVVELSVFVRQNSIPAHKFQYLWARQMQDAVRSAFLRVVPLSSADAPVVRCRAARGLVRALHRRRASG